MRTPINICAFKCVTHNLSLIKVILSLIYISPKMCKMWDNYKKKSAVSLSNAARANQAAQKAQNIIIEANTNTKDGWSRPPPGVVACRLASFALTLCIEYHISQIWQLLLQEFTMLFCCIFFKSNFKCIETKLYCTCNSH